MRLLQDGERIHLVDRKGRHYALTLKAGEVFQFSGETIPHEDMIGKQDGIIVTLSRGGRMMALLPTLGDYVLKMPRGAQVIYPKDLAMITIWGDVYPGARVFEAGTGSGALTMALLRAVGPRGVVVTYETREDFARTAMKNIQRYMGEVPQLTLYRRDAYQGIALGEGQEPFDRLVLDLPEPWRVIPHVVPVLRSGGVYLSFVPTIPQVMQTVEALEQAGVFGQIQTFETLLRNWNIQGRSVRPEHRMVAHSGFITVARKVEAGFWQTQSRDSQASQEETEDSDQSPSEQTDETTTLSERREREG